MADPAAPPPALDLDSVPAEALGRAVERFLGSLPRQDGRPNALADRLALVLARRGVNTRVRFARFLGVTPSYVHFLAKGERRLTSRLREKLLAILDADQS